METASHTMLTDVQLVSLTRDGNSDAYGVLFERYNPSAVKLARYYGADVDADDVAAEVFATVLGVIQRGGGPTESFRAYLFTGVKREMGRRAKTRARTFPVETLPEVPVWTVENTVVATEDAERVRKALLSLSPRHRRLLLQMIVEDMKPREIAAEMGLSPNSVSAVGYRARARFKQALEELENPTQPAPCQSKYAVVSSPDLAVLVDQLPPH